MAKYLSRLGWEVTVATPNPSLWRTVEDHEVGDRELRTEGVRRILTGHQWRCLSPVHLKCWNRGLGWLAGGACRRAAQYAGVDVGVGWNKAALRACAHLSRDDVDLILVSGRPFAAFGLARKLADRLGRPYVLDYRDPWVGNPHANSVWTQRLAQQDEARAVADARAITIVSPSWAEAMSQRFGVGQKLHVISNGYDPEELQVKASRFGHFAIVYTGTFYPPKRVVGPVMAALKRLAELTRGLNRPWRFHYYGDKEDHVIENAKRFGVADRVVTHGNVSRREALSATRGADVAVVITSLLQNGSLADRGMVTGKLFEALGLRTPVLLVTPSRSDAEVIGHSTGLARSFIASETEPMALHLKEMMLSTMRPAPTDVENYAWPHIAGELDRVLQVAAHSGDGVRIHSSPFSV